MSETPLQPTRSAKIGPPAYATQSGQHLHALRRQSLQLQSNIWRVRISAENSAEGASTRERKNCAS